MTLDSSSSASVIFNEIYGFRLKVLYALLPPALVPRIPIKPELLNNSLFLRMNKILHAEKKIRKLINYAQPKPDRVDQNFWKIIEQNE
jgi:hypothetical protein